MLKGVFKKLDPSVMKPVDSVKGEIQLSFKYDFNNELLLVKVIKCRELSNKDIRSKMADTFVKVNLWNDSNTAFYWFIFTDNTFSVNRHSTYYHPPLLQPPSNYVLYHKNLGT